MQDKRNIENVVQEIMGLVSHAMDSAMWAGELILDEDRTHFDSRFEEANDARSLIESKLRELVREQEEEIRVAVARYNLASEIIEARSKERAHNITKDS